MSRTSYAASTPLGASLRRVTSSRTEPAPAMSCRHCRSSDGEVVLDLGHQPSAETFPAADTSPDGDPQHPLRMWLCSSCRLAQLMEDPGTVEEQTVVVESRAMLAQGDATLDFAVEQGLLHAGDRVVEFGSPHGHPLDERLLARGLVPADAADAADAGPAQVVLDIYGLLHEPDQEAALGERLGRVAPGGALVLQLHSLASVVVTGQFSELRHGHFAYWSLPALDDALRARGWGIHRARRFDFDAGTLAVVATADPRPDAEVVELLAAEEATGATNAAGITTLQHGADTATDALRTWLDDERAAGRRVVGYGAAGRSVPLLCHGRIDSTLLTAVADAAPAKHGRRLPGTDIEIVPPSRLSDLRPDRVLLFLPDLLDEVRRDYPEVAESGAAWVTLRPEPVVISSEKTSGQH